MHEKTGAENKQKTPKAKMLRKALVTGATGFIGGHLVKELVANDWKVTCLVRPESQTALLEKHAVSIIRGPVDDPHHLAQALQGQDYIFHLAARIRAANQQDFDLANHRFTRSLVQECLRSNPDLKRFLYVSSMAAAGPSAPGMIHDETNPPSPVSEYGWSKLRGELAVMALRDRLPVTIIRPPYVYGPGQRETELLIKLIRKRIAPALKEETKTTTLIYVKDLIGGMLQAAYSSKASGEIYYLTDGRSYSWREIISILKMQILGRSICFALHENIIAGAALMTDFLKALNIVRSAFGRRAWLAMTRRTWLFSSEKAVKDIGFKSQYALKAGIRETHDIMKRLEFFS